MCITLTDTDLEIRESGEGCYKSFLALSRFGASALQFSALVQNQLDLPLHNNADIHTLLELTPL